MAKELHFRPSRGVADEFDARGRYVATWFVVHVSEPLRAGADRLGMALVTLARATRPPEPVVVPITSKQLGDARAACRKGRDLPEWAKARRHAEAVFDSLPRTENQLTLPIS